MVDKIYITLLLIFVIFITFLFFYFLLKNRKLRHENKLITEANMILESDLEHLKTNNQYLENENKKLDKLARMVKQSPNGIMLMDDEGNVLWINKGFSDLYEYNYKEFIAACGSNYRKTSFDPIKVQERIDQITRTRKPVRYEALNITKSKKELWTQTALMPILDDNGNIFAMATIDTDIHQRIAQSDKLISKMEEINLQVDNMSKQFKILVTETKSLFETINESHQLIEKTDQIIKFIKEVSDKTKILGINASIEANIAGQHGKGFRVVANEIVEISNKTVQSVGKISDLLLSVSKKQEELIKEKTNSEDTINEHYRLMKDLKKEIKEVENSIIEFKTLS